MKKLFVMALTACVAFGVQAAKTDTETAGADKAKPDAVTKEQFVNGQKKMAEKKGIEFDLKKVEALFDKLDINKDGKLTGDEKPKRKAKGEKAEGAATAPATTPAASTAPAAKEKGQPKPVTQEAYIANQKKMAERKGVEFNQAAAEAQFKKLDKNKDGTLTGDELPQRKPKPKAKAPSAESDADESDD